MKPFTWRCVLSTGWFPCKSSSSSYYSLRLYKKLQKIWPVVGDIHVYNFFNRFKSRNAVINEIIRLIIILNDLIMLFALGGRDFALVPANFSLHKGWVLKSILLCSLIDNWWVEHNYHNIPSWISTLIVLMLPSFDLANRALRSSFAGKKKVI